MTAYVPHTSNLGKNEKAQCFIRFAASTAYVAYVKGSSPTPPPTRSHTVYRYWEYPFLALRFRLGYTYATYASILANPVFLLVYPFFRKLDVCGTYAVTYAARMRSWAPSRMRHVCGHRLHHVCGTYAVMGFNTYAARMRLLPFTVR